MFHHKDDLIEQHGNKRKMDQKARSGSWKGVVDKILKEKVDMKIAFEARVRKLKRNLQHEG